MVLSREDLKEQLRRREIAPVYLLFGVETHLRDLAARTIADMSFQPGDIRDFNETSFSLNTEGNLEKALAAAEQLPMMASRRVIKINDVRVSATGFRDTIREKHEPLLSEFLKRPSPHSVVIFISDELNGVRKMGKALREKTVAVEFTRLSDKQLAEWALREFAASGAVIDDASLRFFLSQIGPDVQRLTNEIKKLSVAALPERSIGTQLIQALVPNNRELTNFELTDHLVAGRGSEAVITLNKILNDGAEPIALLGLLSYNYRRLLMAKDMMERNTDRTEIAKALKLRYSDQEFFLRAARRCEAKKLCMAIERLAGVDLAIKTSAGGSGPAGARVQIELLVCELALM